MLGTQKFLKICCTLSARWLEKIMEIYLGFSVYCVSCWLRTVVRNGCAYAYGNRRSSTYVQYAWRIFCLALRVAFSDKYYLW